MAEAYGVPMHPVRLAAHGILGCASRGVYLSPAMRLVAVMMLLWAEDWSRMGNGRYGMTPEEIADRTSLTEKQVRDTLTKMVECRLVRERADSWELTEEDWKRSVLKHWLDEANFRVAKRS